MIKAVIFDLDGTVGNTLPLCVAAFRSAVEPLIGRVVSDEDIINTFGPSEEGTINQLAPFHYEQGVADYICHYERLHDMCPEPFEGIREVLLGLRARGIIVGMVTGKGEKSCMITLRRYGIDGLFDMVECGWIHGPRKVDGIQAVLDRFVLLASEAVYVGDVVSDVLASREVGVGIVSAAWAATADYDGLVAAQPDELFRSIGDFAKYCTQI